MTMAEFTAKPAARQEEPLLIGLVGPPGGGKTLSSLKVAKGIQAVRGGPIVLIDTEGGRSRKYSDLIPFEIVEFQPPCRSERFLEAIKAQLPKNPAAIIVDSMSEEHEGEGGYLEWHDEMIPKMGGNEWAAWSKPKASRKKLISGILHIKTPLIFTFRAREKTKQDGKKVVNIGWQPVAPLEIVHTLDLTCILPPRADGVPVWKSDKVGEDFIIKLPNYLQPFIQQGKALSEEMGRNFALWAKGGAAGPPAEGARAATVSGPKLASPASDLPNQPQNIPENIPDGEMPVDPLLAKAREKATEGSAVFDPWAKKLTDRQIAKLEPHMAELNRRVAAADVPA